MSVTFSRRMLLQFAGAAVLSPSIVHAQSGSVARIYVGYSPGGAVDVLARLLAPLLSPDGSHMIVENKPGASGQIAAVALSRAAPDGSKLLLTPVTNLTLTPQLYRKPIIDPLKDFTPIGPLCELPFALAVTGSSPIKTVAEFIAWGKAEVKGVSFASPGAGTSTHLLGLVLSKEIGVPMTHVGYKGAMPGLQDLVAGHIDSTFNALPSMIEMHRSSKIRILAHTNSKRLARLPEVPTFAELKISGLEYAEVFGVFAPPNTPTATVARLEAKLQQASSSPALMDALRKLELEPRHEGAAAYKKFYEADYKRWTLIARESGVTIDA